MTKNITTIVLNKIRKMNINELKESYGKYQQNNNPSDQIEKVMYKVFEDHDAAVFNGFSSQSYSLTEVYMILGAIENRTKSQTVVYVFDLLSTIMQHKPNAISTKYYLGPLSLYEAT